MWLGSKRAYVQNSNCLGELTEVSDLYKNVRDIGQ